MIKEKFFPNTLALITLLSACGIVAISMGIRQTFGLFSDFFVKDLQSTVTQFGLAIGIQMLLWGMFAPIFGAMADKIGGNKVTIIAFVFFGSWNLFTLFRTQYTGIFFHINLGLLVGIGLGGTAISVQIGEVGKHFPNKNKRYGHWHCRSDGIYRLFFLTIVYKICFISIWLGEDTTNVFVFYNFWDGCRYFSFFQLKKRRAQVATSK